MSDLSIEARQVGEGTALVIVIGSLDATTYEKMEQQIDALFAKSYYRLIVNMQQVHYISSAGAGVFIGAVGTAQDHNGHIILLQPSPNVHDVFEILGLSEIFPFRQTLEESLEYFNKLDS